VVLPAPLGPSSPTDSPGWTVNETPSTATTLPNRFFRPETSSIAIPCLTTACYPAHRRALQRAPSRKKSYLIACYWEDAGEIRVAPRLLRSHALGLCETPVTILKCFSYRVCAPSGWTYEWACGFGCARSPLARNPAAEPAARTRSMKVTSRNLGL